MIDQAYAPGVAARGEVRVGYVFDAPLEVMVATPAEGVMGSTVPSGATHHRPGVDDPKYKPLLEGFARRDIHQLMPALGLPPGTSLPMFWSADFISIDAADADADPAAAAAGGDGQYGYVMTGLRCSVS